VNAGDFAGRLIGMPQDTPLHSSRLAVQLRRLGFVTVKQIQDACFRYGLG
jgi:hypothetical protein